MSEAPFFTLCFSQGKYIMKNKKNSSHKFFRFRKILGSGLVAGSMVFAIFSCNSNYTAVDYDEFALFSTKEVFDSVNGSDKMIPVIDRYISVPADQDLLMKVSTLLDSVSVHNFNGLKIETDGIDENADHYKILKINLKENPGFKMPDSLGNYRSWYDFFQGSMGGGRTTIILIESALQKQYKGEWVDAVEFCYQNEKMGEWDHVLLSGINKRS
jgi:hypothetical protein